MPNTKSPPQISQRLLKELLRRQNSRKGLESDLRYMKKEEDAILRKIEAAYKAGATVAPGVYTCGYKEGKRSPKWKDEFISRLGEDAAEQVIANTEPSKVFFVGSE